MKKHINHIVKADKILAKHIKRIGAITRDIEKEVDPFQALMTSIVYQQLNGRAASVILERVLALFGKDFPSPNDILKMPEEKLRSAGLSRAKTVAIKDLALKSTEGVVPTALEISTLSDEEIVERLVTIRGIGRWTVEMLLIKMGRHDILPTADYGIRKAFQLVYKKRKLPTPKALEKYGEIWKPYRTMASLYLWQILDTKDD
jgi:3-methyladenine DNA glycosylase/8-oxoguanine DNA glycosylase